MWEVDVALIADWLRSLDQASYEHIRTLRKKRPAR